MNRFDPSVRRLAAVRAAEAFGRAVVMLAVLVASIALSPSLLPSANAALPIEQWTTPSGARVLFVRAPSIPMLDVRIDFDAGSRYDPPDKAGLAALTQGMLLRGAKGLDESAIDEGFADLGALVGGSAGSDRASVSLRSLSSRAELDAAVDLLGRLLAAPSFAEPVFERERERVLQAVREADLRPASIAQRAFDTMLYGAHPYGLNASVETLARIRREDMQAFFSARYGARRAVVSMIGDVDRRQAEAIAERLTRVLPAGGEPPAMPPVALPDKAAERRIAHGASQSHILIGVPAIARGDDDFFALLVGNYVLGGGSFVSRLYGEVREKRGLAYSVYSYFSPQLQLGPFTIGLQTQKAQTAVALEVVRETLARFMREGPTAAEIEAAKDNLVGGFALRIDSNAKILENLSLIGYYRLPLDYLDTWPSRIQAVTVDQVRAAFARHVPIDRLVTVVVGAGEAVAQR
ncbi:MAG: pitrilysin family protein [Burkholderiaceae bacterium]